jgi:hypothetical protein
MRGTLLLLCVCALQLCWSATEVCAGGVAHAGGLEVDVDEPQFRDEDARTRTTPRTSGSGGGAHRSPPTVTLLEAAEKGLVRDARALLDDGVSIHEFTRKGSASGSNALHIASGNGHFEIVQMLLDAGMDPNFHMVCEDGLTPLVLSVMGGSLRTVNTLLEGGALPNKKDLAGYSPLHVAIRKGYADVAEALLSAGAFKDVEVDIDGTITTPLLLAADAGETEIVEVLLAAGSDPQKTAKGSTRRPIVVALDKGHAEMVAILQEHDRMVLDDDVGMGYEPTYDGEGEWVAYADRDEGGGPEDERRDEVREHQRVANQAIRAEQAQPQLRDG